MKDPPQIIVLGSVNTDFVVRVPTLPRPGVTVIGSDFVQASGGKGANQAVAAARAGTSGVLFLGAVGDDALGRSAREALGREGIVLDHLAVLPGVPSGAALITVDDAGENAIAVAPGANAGLTPSHIDAVPESLWRQAKVFLASLEVPLDTVRRGLQRARAAGLTTVLNPAPVADAAAVAALLPLVDVLTPNEHEADQLTGPRVGGLSARFEQGKSLCRLGCRQAMITIGAPGVVLASSEECRHLPGLTVDVVDTTAAGDAFNGALAAAFAEGRDWRVSASFANAAAALSVTALGAQPPLPRRERIEALLAAIGERLA